MDDVVLHYQPGSASGLSFLLQTTQKVLEPFPCLTPPAFSPWFPAAADLQLPIRPARPAPVIPSLTDDRHTAAAEASDVQEGESENRDCVVASVDATCVSETPTDPPASRTTPSPQKPDKDGVMAARCPLKRSWSVSSHGGVLLQSSLSKQFTRMVSVHSLHLRQRAKWAIRQDNCGAASSIEQVWRTLSRSVQRAKLPTCNANIQRERAEIWVFCDVVHAEQVGRFLKDQLQLSGRISLSVHRLGDVFSL